jgi:hypothetical protein
MTADLTHLLLISQDETFESTYTPYLKYDKVNMGGMVQAEGLE